MNSSVRTAASIFRKFLSKKRPSTRRRGRDKIPQIIPDDCVTNVDRIFHVLLRGTNRRDKSGSWILAPIPS